MTNKIIKRISVNSKNGQRLVYIPKNSELKAGEFVVISKATSEDLII
jgi:hypothetical protein